VSEVLTGRFTTKDAKNTKLGTNRQAVLQEVTERTEEVFSLTSVSSCKMIGWIGLHALRDLRG
jgi:hypothetical protein